LPTGLLKKNHSLTTASIRKAVSEMQLRQKNLKGNTHRITEVREGRKQSYFFRMLQRWHIRKKATLNRKRSSQTSKISQVIRTEGNKKQKWIETRKTKGISRQREGQHGMATSSVINPSSS
jgi:hypothetical protein